MEAQRTALVFLTSDDQEVLVDKYELRWTSKVFQDMLADCDTGQVKVDETKENMDKLLSVVRGQPLPSTFDISSTQCWEDYKQLLQAADKYHMQLVMDRCEKWLVSRCLRGKIVDPLDFGFHDPNIARDWVLICQNLGLKDLGWYCAYDLGRAMAAGLWPRATQDFLREVADPELLKVILQGSNDGIADAHGGGAAGVAAAALPAAAHAAAQPAADHEAP